MTKFWNHIDSIVLKAFRKQKARDRVLGGGAEKKRQEERKRKMEQWRESVHGKNPLGTDHVPVLVRGTGDSSRHMPWPHSSGAGDRHNSTLNNHELRLLERTPYRLVCEGLPEETPLGTAPKKEIKTALERESTSGRRKNLRDADTSQKDLGMFGELWERVGRLDQRKDEENVAAMRCHGG